jgi:erythromycin esterase
VPIVLQYHGFSTKRLSSFYSSDVTFPCPAATALLALAAFQGVASAPLPASPASPFLTLDFEGPAPREGWSVTGRGCSLAADRTIARSGRASLVLDCSVSGGGAVSGVATRRLAVQGLRGRRIVVSGYLRTEMATAGRAVLQVEVEGANGSLAYADTGEGRSAGTTAWKRFAIAVDVPREATGVAVGARIAGSGRMWLDDLAVEPAVVGPAVAAPSPAPQAVVDWVRANAIPLAGASPDLGLDDLAPLGRLLGEARIVGLGEATHGSREFFQVKHRLLEYLVAEKGFTVLAVEANWPESLAVDDYVQGGPGDPAQLLAGFHYWMWATEEMLDLLRWLRAWNADSRHARKVHVYGFDAQFPERATDAVAIYLRKVDPEYGAAVAGLLERVRRHRIGAADRAVEPPAGPGLAALLARLDERQADYAAAAGRREWTLARHAATILVQEEAMRDVSEAGVFDVRDRAMAENVAWLLDQEPPGARMVVWAHNGHVSRCDPFAAVHPLGEHLRRRFGAGYLAIGFVFNRGAFQAIDGSRRRETLAERTLGPAPPEDLGAAFARTGLPAFVLDLRGLQSPGAAAADWLAQRHPMRETGAIFTGEAAMVFPVVVPERFDAVLFVDRTTRARPLPPP